jgi:single-strand DNA-binding protein
MNTVVLIGRLTKDPEVRYTQGQNPICIARYTLAVDRPHTKDKTDFISCKALGKSGQFAEKYLHKGTKISVCGRIETGSYQNKEGKTVYTTDVIVDDHEFVESKAAEASANASNTQTDLSGFMAIPDDITEELPFT